MLYDNARHAVVRAIVMAFFALAAWLLGIAISGETDIARWSNFAKAFAACFFLAGSIVAIWRLEISDSP